MLRHRMRSVLDALFVHRRSTVAVALMLAALVHVASSTAFSWHFVASGSRILWSPAALHLYALAPQLQMGPLTFVVGGLFAVALPQPLGIALVVVAMLAVGWVVIDRSSSVVELSTDRARRAWTLAAVAAAVVWTEVSVHYAHLDDVLALGAMVGAVTAARNGRFVACALWIGVAIDCKPWALPLVALLAAAGMRQAVRGAVVIGLVVLAAWLPFFLADSGTVHILGFTIPVSASSSLPVLGVHETVTPGWDRAVQLGGGAVLVGIAAVRRRWDAVVVLLVAWRMILDPASYSYYDSGLLIGTLSFDGAGAARRDAVRLPTTTVVALIGVSLSAYLLPESGSGVIRTISLAVVLGVVLVGVLRRPPVGDGGLRRRDEVGLARVA